MGKVKEWIYEKERGPTDHFKEETVGKINVTCQSFEEVKPENGATFIKMVFVSCNCLLLFVTIK